VDLVISYGSILPLIRVQLLWGLLLNYRWNVSTWVDMTSHWKLRSLLMDELGLASFHLLDLWQ